MKPTEVNGVDVSRLFASIEAMTMEPSLARFEFRLKNQWVDGGLNQSVIQDFYGAGKEDQTRDTPFLLSNDEPDVLLGSNQAPNPVEFILHGLAGCLTTSMVYHAAAKGYTIRKLSSVFKGEIDLRGLLGISREERNGYKWIEIEFDIEGDFTEEQKKEILSFGPTHSPVYDTLLNPVPIRVSLASKKTAAAVDC